MSKEKSNIKTTDWLIRGISPEKLEKEKDRAIKSANKELARRKKKIQKEKQRILKRLAKVNFTYEEVEDIFFAYLSIQQPFNIPDEIVDAFNSIPRENLIPYSELVKAMENQKNIVADTIENISISKDGILSAKNAKCSDGIKKLCAKDCIYGKIDTDKR